MARGGARPNAGRKPGAAVERTREVANAISSDGDITPLEVMVRSMRVLFNKAEQGQTVDDGTRTLSPLALYGMAADVASKAAPFIHPKLANVEMTGKDGGPMETVTRIELVAMDDGSTD